MIIGDESEAASGGQTVSSLRLRVLLGVLAEDDLERRSLAIPRESLDEVARWFRLRFDLAGKDDLLAFLRFADLDLRDFTAQMRTFASINHAHRLRAAEVEAEVDRYRRFRALERWCRTEKAR